MYHSQTGSNIKVVVRIVLIELYLKRDLTNDLFQYLKNKNITFFFILKFNPVDSKKKSIFFFYLGNNPNTFFLVIKTFKLVDFIGDKLTNLFNTLADISNAFIWTDLPWIFQV